MEQLSHQGSLFQVSWLVQHMADLLASWLSMLPIETVLTKERMFSNASPWAQFCKIWACSLFGHMPPQLVCLYMIAVMLDPLCSCYLEISISHFNLCIWKMDYVWVAWFQLNQTDLASSYFQKSIWTCTAHDRSFWETQYLYSLSSSWQSAVWSVIRYALLGAASFLGGSMRMTVSLCVIMVEITNNLKLLPLIMLVLLISKVL